VVSGDQYGGRQAISAEHENPAFDAPIRVLDAGHNDVDGGLEVVALDPASGAGEAATAAARMPGVYPWTASNGAAGSCW
jgi:hypothetical protein